jgi:multidrug efflux pump subunit AcrB
VSLTRLALGHRRIAIFLLILIAAAGLSQYADMARNDMPPYVVRVASVVTRFAGASPQRVEQLVTDPVENVIQEFPEVKTITSESRTALSVVTIKLHDSVAQEQLQPIWDRLRRKLDRLASTLPEGVSAPDLKDDDIGVVVALQSDGFSDAEMEHYADELKRVLIRLPNAAKVELSGIQDKRIFIEFDDARLAKLGLTSSMLQNILRSTNIISSGGEVTLGSQQVILEPTGNLDSLAALGETLIPVKSGPPLRLRDIVRIQEGYVTPRKSMVRVNGRPSVGLHVSLKEGANIVELGREVDQAVAEQQKSLPIGLELRRIASQDEVVQTSVNDFVSNLMQAVVVVLAVMLLFLGLRTGLVVASLIPMTLLMTLAAMGVTGQGLNQVTLAGLIMALGMLVDNAIVIAESMMVKLQQGMGKVEAAIGASGELAIPLLISSLTTSAAFMPFYLAKSTMGDITGPLFVVISLALLSSWFMALVLVPLLGVVALKVGVAKEASSGPIAQLKTLYAWVLDRALSRRLTFAIAVVVLLIGSVATFGLLPFNFFPDSERALVTVDIKLPLGTKIERTEAVVEKLERFIRKELLVYKSGPSGAGKPPASGRTQGVVSWSSFIGEGPVSYDLGYQPEEANSAYAHMLINTSSGLDNELVIQKIDRFCFEQLPDAEVKAKRLSGGGTSVPVEVRLFGPDATVLYRLMEPIKEKLVQIQGTKSVGDNWGLRIKKLVIDIDQARAQRAGVTNSDVAVSLQTVLKGFKSSELRREDESIPIILRSEDAGDYSVARLEGVTVHAQNGAKSAPLGQVADVRIDWQYASIRRRDLNRALSVSSYLQDGFNATDITAVLLPWLEAQKKGWPTGYTYELGGEAESSAEGLQSVADQLPLAGFIILCLLIVQFDSFRKTGIVLSTIPLGLIGVILGLHLFRSYFGFFAFLGVISLAGIVINNAIVLIDRIAIELEAGATLQVAIVEAAKQRFRPIVLTTCTTVLGLIPLYFGGGLMWEPMAVAIMVGLLFATVITLLFVPVLYSLLYRAKAS